MSKAASISTLLAMTSGRSKYACGIPIRCARDLASFSGSGAAHWRVSSSSARCCCHTSARSTSFDHLPLGLLDFAAQVLPFALEALGFLLQRDTAPLQREEPHGGRALQVEGGELGFGLTEVAPQQWVVACHLRQRGDDFPQLVTALRGAVPLLRRVGHVVVGGFRRILFA